MRVTSTRRCLDQLSLYKVAKSTCEYEFGDVFVQGNFEKIQTIDLYKSCVWPAVMLGV